MARSRSTTPTLESYAGALAWIIRAAKTRLILNTVDLIQSLIENATHLQQQVTVADAPIDTGPGDRKRSEPLRSDGPASQASPARL